MPSSRQAFKTRSAISPRLATSTLRNIHVLLKGTGFSPYIKTAKTSRASAPAGVQRLEDEFIQSWCKRPSRAPNRKQGLPKLDGLAVGDEALHDLARGIGFDLVHQLHGFDNADHLALVHMIAGGNKGRRAGRR